MTPPTPPDGEVTVGELGRWLNRVDKQLGVLTTEIRDQRTEYLHRTEWDLWCANANRELDDMREAAKAALAASTTASKAAEDAAGLAGAAKASVQELATDVGDHETRIRSLEVMVWKAAGAAAALGAGAGFGLTQLLHLVP